MTSDNNGESLSDEAITSALNEFREAFDNLLWERFCACFAPECSVYLPFPDARRLVHGKAAVEASFAPFFEQLLATVDGPPYLNLQPREVRIDRHGSMALVTFHLEFPDHFGQRTLVMVEQQGRWLIQHLHASNIYSE